MVNCPNIEISNKSTIFHLVQRFPEAGHVAYRQRSGRPSVLHGDNLHDIRQSLLHSQKKSVRKLS